MSISLVRAESQQDSSPRHVDAGRRAATIGLKAAHLFIADPANRPEVERALRIRAVENALYELFGLGKLHGTIHTCIGQEFSGALLGKHLRDNDFVTSNHRCHGHFIGATENWRGLIDEIVGNKDGVCAGIGSSQHLWAKNFLSNGQQGGLLPVAAGIAFDRQLKGAADVVVSFLGEGTLGEGILYETLNLDALWGLPHVVICENNFYSQSTRQERGVAGTIADRGTAFAITTAEANTWDLPTFDAVLATAMERARRDGQPTFLVLKTYRLNPHSKGDDLREKSEIAWFQDHDPATLAVRHYDQFTACYDDYVVEARDYIALSLEKPALDRKLYFVDQLPRTEPGSTVAWAGIDEPQANELRIAQQLNAFYKAWLHHDETAVFLGEDIEDPYGGAFKIAKGLTTAFAERARTTPISEAAIAGIGIGLAIAGRRALVEMMFGDFITYAFDQIINNASKMYHMYNFNVGCGVVIRTPMGGRRGYGPTHSQSLERFLIGIDNCCTVSLNSIASVTAQLSGLATLQCPIILLENKSDYTERPFKAAEGMVIESDHAVIPTFRIRPMTSRPTVTLLSYGGMARFVATSLVEIFERCDVVPELVVITSISPLDLEPIVGSVAETGRLVVIEEGAGFGSVGAEVIAQLSERRATPFVSARVCGKPTPIPSAPALEAATLPSVEDICVAIERLKERSA